MSKAKQFTPDRKQRADRDLVALGIATAAIILFVGTGSAVIPQIVRSWLGSGDSPSVLLSNALLLNIALIVFGLRRYRELIGEIKERREAEEAARELAETDPLTGCLNRRRMTAEITRLLDEQSTCGGGVALLMVDLDNFKQINDYHGHASGDALLKTVSERINGLLPSGAMLARLGGDEFACLVPVGPSGSDEIGTLSSRLVEKVSAVARIDDNPVNVTVSVGIAESKDGLLDAATLIHQADVAMYHAKKLGKNRRCWFEPALESALRQRQKLEQGIRSGLEKSEFVPFYEQQIDLQSGRIVGFEMLARWDNAEMANAGPATFIPIAEEIGVIAELSFQVIGKALDDAKHWDPSLGLSVNISPIQLRDPWFAQKLLKLLVEHNFPANRLNIEVTENILLENLGLVRSMVASLRNLGVKISLDDFGTGYSSLSQLRSLPFDRLKIDQSLVAEMHKGEAGAKIVDAIIRLGDGLSMPITVEGVDEPSILEALAQYDHLSAQGYLFGQPENAADVRVRLAALDLLIEPPAPRASMDNTPPKPRKRA